MNSLAKKCVEILFPASCLGCRVDLPSYETKPICSECVSQFKYAGSQSVHLMGLNKVHCGAYFDGRMKDLIHAFKYRGKDYLAPLLVDVMTQFSEFDWASVDAVISVPMSYWKEMRRGYNQSAILAKELTRRFKIPLLKNVLYRKSFSPSQTDLSRSDRFLNAHKSFGVRPIRETNKFKNVLLVDDVFTTGATLQACAALLQKWGVTSLSACTAAVEVL